MQVKEEQDDGASAPSPPKDDSEPEWETGEEDEYEDEVKDEQVDEPVDEPVDMAEKKQQSLAPWQGYDEEIYEGLARRLPTHLRIVGRILAYRRQVLRRCADFDAAKDNGTACYIEPPVQRAVTHPESCHKPNHAY